MTQYCPECGAALLDDGTIPFCAKCLARISLGISRTRDKPPFEDEQDAIPIATARREFGDYELLQEIAHGGTAVVWRAKQLSVGRIVALKILRNASVAKPEDRKRFRAEAAAIASLQHPNIVALHDFGEHERQPWISMDFIEGQTLA